MVRGVRVAQHHTIETIVGRESRELPQAQAVAIKAQQGR
jgi:hypothetical protein